jgi:hypothetical protein
MTPKQTSVRLDGAICGYTWMPQSMAGIPTHANLQSEAARLATPPDSMRDILLHVLMEKGGDFQDARFSADTLIIVGHHWQSGPVSKSHARYVRVADWPGCEDLIHADADSSDFIPEEF